MGKPAKPEIDVEQLLLEKMRVLFEKACEKMEGVHSFLLQPAAKAAAGRYKPLKAAAHVGALVLTSAAQSEGPPTFEEFVSELDTNDKVTNGIFEFLVKETATPSLSTRRERRSEGPTARLAMASRRNRSRRANLHPLVQLFGPSRGGEATLLSSFPLSRPLSTTTAMDTLEDI